MPNPRRPRPGVPEAPWERSKRRGGMPDARRYTKCSECGDLLWFDSWDPVPQAVQCKCNATRLTEDDIIGPATTPSQAEVDFMTGVGPPP